VVALDKGRPLAVMAFTVTHGKVVAIDCVLDPARLARLDLAALDA
jgi:RNA polymerase sigma-70 factor (ECF subfamily)